MTKRKILANYAVERGVVGNKKTRIYSPVCGGSVRGGSGSTGGSRDTKTTRETL